MASHQGPAQVQQAAQPVVDPYHFDSNGFPTRLVFANDPRGAHNYRHRPKGQPRIDPHKDPTIAQILAQEEQYIAVLMQAFYDTESAKDDANADAREYCDRSQRHHFELEDVEQTCRAVMHELHARCTVGYRGHPDQDRLGKTRRGKTKSNVQAVDVTGNCQVRLNNILKTLREWKSVCMGILYHDFHIMGLVNAPASISHDKGDQKRGNATKARKTTENKRLAEQVKAQGVVTLNSPAPNRVKMNSPIIQDLQQSLAPALGLFAPIDYAMGRAEEGNQQTPRLRPGPPRSEALPNMSKPQFAQHPASRTAPTYYAPFPGVPTKNIASVGPRFQQPQPVAGQPVSAATDFSHLHPPTANHGENLQTNSNDTNNLHNTYNQYFMHSHFHGLPITPTQPWSAPSNMLPSMNGSQPRHEVQFHNRGAAQFGGDDFDMAHQMTQAQAPTLQARHAPTPTYQGGHPLAGGKRPRPEDMYTEPLPHPDRVKVDGNGGLQAGGEWEGDGAMQDEEWNDDVDAEGDNDDDDPENGISSADQ
jgi:hypothetical protein